MSIDKSLPFNCSDIWQKLVDLGQILNHQELNLPIKLLCSKTSDNNSKEFDEFSGELTTFSLKGVKSDDLTRLPANLPNFNEIDIKICMRIIFNQPKLTYWVDYSKHYPIGSSDQNKNLLKVLLVNLRSITNTEKIYVLELNEWGCDLSISGYVRPQIFGGLIRKIIIHTP